MFQIRTWGQTLAALHRIVALLLKLQFTNLLEFHLYLDRFRETKTH